MWNQKYIYIKNIFKKYKNKKAAPVSPLPFRLLPGLTRRAAVAPAMPRRLTSRRAASANQMRTRVRMTASPLFLQFSSTPPDRFPFSLEQPAICSRGKQGRWSPCWAIRFCCPLGCRLGARWYWPEVRRGLLLRSVFRLEVTHALLNPTQQLVESMSLACL